MKSELKISFWFIPVLFVIFGFVWWYLFSKENSVAIGFQADGVITFYDASSGTLKRLAMNPELTRVFRNSNGSKYLLQSKYFGQADYICDVNGAQLKEVLLAGRQIITHDTDYVLIQKTFENNKEPWEMTYDYGLVLTEKDDHEQDSSTEYPSTANIIMWGNSKLAVYDKGEDKIYEELFFGQYLNIEKVLPCKGSKIAVFTSEYEYPQEYDPDWEYCATNRRISFSVIDYHLNGSDLQSDINDVNQWGVNDFIFDFNDIQWPVYYGTKLISVENFSGMDVTSSSDKTYAAGIINNSTVFLINIETRKIVFIKPLIKSVNGNINSNIHRIEVSNGGVVSVLKHYTGNGDLLVDEIYSCSDDIPQIRVIEDM